MKQRYCECGASKEVWGKEAWEGTNNSVKRNDLTRLCKYCRPDKEAKMLYSPMPFRQVIGASNVLCSDGKRRKFRANIGGADTFFSVSGRVIVRGKTVSGFITMEHNDIQFTANDGGKNKDVIKR